MKNGEPPIYVGFGSVVVEDATAMTRKYTSGRLFGIKGTWLRWAETIFDAVEKAGCRALVSAGWGGLGGANIPESVFILKGTLQILVPVRNCNMDKVGGR